MLAGPMAVEMADTTAENSAPKRAVLTAEWRAGWTADALAEKTVAMWAVWTAPRLAVNWAV